MKKIPFSPPKINEAVIQEVTDALRSGWITTGPKTKALEKAVEEMCGIPKVLCVNSATAGMELILRWFGVGEGDEVIVPAYTYCATANVVMHLGAKPVMADVRREDLTIDPMEVNKLITEKTKCILSVDLGGMPAAYLKLRKLIEAKKDLFQANNDQQAQLGRILLMSDAAHSIGAKYQAKPAAQFTDVSVFSFHAVKNLTTAEGGAICLNLPAPFDNSNIYKQLNTKSLHGQNKDALAKFGANAWEYDVVEAGYKCNMPDVLAAIGLAEIGTYESETLPKRKAIFDRYTDLLKNEKWAELAPYNQAGKCSSYHLFILRIKGVDLAQRNEIIGKIMSEGVSVNVHYKPLPLLSFYKNAGYQMGEYPVACDAWHREITLPVYYDLDLEAVDYVVKILKASVEEVLDKDFFALPICGVE